MSRIGKKPVPIPDGVKVGVSQREITVEGKLGKLVWTHRPEVNVEVNAADKEVVVTRSSDERMPRALHGLTRALIRNMVEGVATMLDPTINMWDVSGPYVKAWLRDELGPEAKLADQLFEAADTLKRLPSLIRRLEDQFPDPGGAPPPPPLPDVKLIQVKAGGFWHYAGVAILAAALGAGAMWFAGHRGPPHDRPGVERHIP